MESTIQLICLTCTLSFFFQYYSEAPLAPFFFFHCNVQPMVSQSQGTHSINAEWLGFNIFSPINLHVTGRHILAGGFLVQFFSPNIKKKIHQE